jgi:EpsI family protein
LESSNHSPGPRHWLLPALATALATVAYRDLLLFDPAADVAAEVEGFFFQPSYTPPRVVLVLAAWLLYRRRERLQRLPVGGGTPWPGAALLASALGLLAWSSYTGASDLLALSLSLALLGTGALVRGPRAIRVLALPAVFLVFAVPLPAPLLNYLVFPLQIATADITGWFLQGIGFPVYVLGDQILGAEENFVVIEACSGLRSVETLTMIAILLIDLFRRSGWHAVIILVAAPIVAFALNGVRAVTLVLNPHSEIVAIHNLQGVAILLAGLVTLYLLDGFLVRHLRERGGKRPPRAPGPPGERSAAGRRAPVLVATAAAAAALSLWIPRWELAWPTSSFAARLIPETLDGWRAKGIPLDQMFLGRAGFAQVVNRRYRRDGEEVRLFVGVGDRSNRMRSPFTPKTHFPGSGWSVEERGTVELEAGRPTVEWRVVQSTTSRRLVYHWREASGALGDEVIRNLLALDSSPLRRPGEGVVVRMSTPVAGPGPEDRRIAEGRLLRFYRDFRPELRALGERLTRGKGFPDFPDLGKDFPPAASGGES